MLRHASYLIASAGCLGLCGCLTFWDDVTSADFSFSSFFSKPNPLLVLRDSKDGDKRARALRALQEPNQRGGTEAEQEAVVKILVTAASTESQPLCRLAAIQSLSQFKDPRAVQGLVDAFYAAGTFTPETAAIVRCRAVTALGRTQNPAAVELLSRVVKEPPAEGSDLEKQQALDVRVAAARALGHFNQAPATEALVQVLKTEKDAALRDGAYESLQLATGQKLPPDAAAWDEFLHNGVKPEPKRFSLVGWIKE